jgi:ssDNA-binding Zn-finger/Zn-ribbon topoisomerase 1
MSQLTKQQYEHQAANCDGLCDIDRSRTSIAEPHLMPCVTCPFCKEIVTAELTQTTIHCPQCKVTVRR